MNSSKSLKKCPHCAESIQLDAKKCRYCGEWLRSEPATKKQSSFTVVLWMGSLFLWFLYATKTLDKSQKAYEFTLNSGPVMSGYSIFLLGILLTLLLKKHVFTKRLGFKSILAKVAVTAVVAFGLWVQLSYNPFPFNQISISGYSQDVNGLRRTVERQNQLSEQTDREAAAKEVYNNFLSPKDRLMSEDEFVKGYLDFWNGKYSNIVINSIKVDGSIGYVDRTSVFCTNKECSVVEGKSRGFKVYEYENGHWYYRVKDVVCPRTVPYDMEPEFSRALSLIQQRSLSPTGSSSDDEKEAAEDFKRTMNCVHIAYASTEADMNGAEGVFRFVPGQSPESMTIFVSPRYKSKDDILTAVLLTHELTHAYNYVIGLYNGETTDCYYDEALAFSAQNSFISTLNNEEKQSLTARFARGGSPELVGTIQAYTQVPKMGGTNYLEKATNFVKSNPGYQKQCSGR